MAQEKGTLYDTRIIYTPSQFAKKNLIHLQETGTIKAKSPRTNSRQNLNSYLLFVVTKGSGELIYDGIKYTLEKGSCVFIDCHTPYSHRSSNDLWELKWAHFYGPNLKGIYEKYLERGGTPTYKSKRFSEYVSTLELIFNIADSDHYIRDMQLFETLTHLLSLILSETYRENFLIKKNNINAIEIKEYIDNNYSEKITLDYLATKFYINKFYLSRIFNQQFDISPIEYLLHVRITRAKSMLRFSDLSIEAIANECGIDDSNYFSRIFKKIEGYSPSEYRKRW